MSRSESHVASAEIGAAQQSAADSGMVLRDLLTDTEFLGRTGKERSLNEPFDALKRVVEVFAERPGDVLQELLNAAVSCCHADSAGISLEEPDADGKPTFRWVAIAGSFEQYLGGRTPRFFSPCGVCLDKARPQLYRVTKPYYDFLGVTADEITDGMLIPWEANGQRGTIWAVAHRSNEAFDRQDYELLKSLADFVSIVLRQQALAEKARLAARAEASVERAHRMAHQINNPLQSLTNTMFLASRGGPDVQQYLDQAVDELRSLSERVKKLLAVKYDDVHG